MARHKRIGKAIRWSLFALWVLCMGVGLVFLFGIFFDFGFGAGLMGTPSYLASYFYYIYSAEKLYPFESIICVAATIIYLGLFIFTQWLFLSSKKHWRVKTQKTGRPMKKAVIGVAFATSLLSIAFIFSICDLISDKLLNSPNFFLLSVPIVLWILWSIIFTVYFYQSDYLKWSGRIN